MYILYHPCKVYHRAWGRGDCILIGGGIIYLHNDGTTLVRMLSSVAHKLYIV